MITTIEKKQGLVVLLLFLLLPTRMLGDAILNTEPKRSHGHPNILALPQLLPAASVWGTPSSLSKHRCVAAHSTTPLLTSPLSNQYPPLLMLPISTSILHLFVCVTFSLSKLCQPKLPRPSSDLGSNVISSESSLTFPSGPPIILCDTSPVSFRVPFTSCDYLVLVFGGRNHV